MSASLILSMPGKTFLAGEYWILKSGTALVAATEPGFNLFVSKGSGKLTGIHSESPAGKLHADHFSFFKNFDLDFKDDVQLGGLGASTAQFLGLYAFLKLQKNLLHEAERYLDHRQMLLDYQRYAWNGQGVAPSGADLIAQERGYLTVFDKSLGRISRASWSFSDLDFYLIHTGIKLATHEHLKSAPDFQIEKMQLAFGQIVKSLEVADAENFCQGIESYASALLEQGLTASHSVALLEQIRKLSGVRAAKGCGAMGSDVLLVCCDKQQKQEALLAFCDANQLKIMASNASLVPGLQVKVLNGDLF